MKRFTCVLVCTLVTSCRTGEGVEPNVTVSTLPAPTDPRGGGDDQQRRHLRERWVEEMHRAAPGTDWRAIEAGNWERERLRRNRLAAAGVSGGKAYATADSWEEVGSRNQAGHTRCATLGPARSGFRYLYVGSANGGLWRGPTDGSDWSPMSDGLFGGIDEVLALEPWNLANEDIVVMRRGASAYRSDDGGATWTAPAGLDAVDTIRRMLLLPDGLQTVLLMTQATVGGVGSRTVLYASTDLGQSFQVRWQSPLSWPGDVWVPRYGPGAGSDVYILQKGKVRKSTDGGFSFSLWGKANAVATEGSLQGSEAGAPHLYAALKVSGVWELYRSSDGGHNFTLQKSLPGYWGAVSSLATFSTNPDAVFYGGVEGFRSQNGGATFQEVNDWTDYYGDPANKLHADLRGLSPMPDPDQLGLVDLLYVNTDGGTYLTTDQGFTVSNLCLEGLGVGQFYTTHTSVRDPALIVGGTQDQGYQRGFRMANLGDGPSTPFNQLISGDYGHLTSSDGDHDYLYSTYPGFILVQVDEWAPSLYLEDFPVGASNLWLPPVVADPLNESSFFFLADHLWRYDKGSDNSWTPTQHAPRDFGAGASHNYLSALDFSPVDPQRAYAVTDGGRIFYSTTHGTSWIEATNGGASSHYFYGSALDAHPTDPLRAVLGGSGYSSVGVHHTIDGGQSWQALDSGLPSTLVFDIVWAPDGTDDIYAATDAGAYRFDSAAGTWVNLMGVEAPSTTYWSVESVPDEAIIRFGTYGRGVWDYRYDVPTNSLLFLDGFETGDYGGGGWLTKNKKAKLKSGAARGGEWGARLKRVTNIERSIDTSGYSTIRVEYSRRTANYVAGEVLRAQWWNGNNWVLIESTADKDWADVSFTLPIAAGNNPAFKLRFRTNSHVAKGRADLDDVRVYGTL